jgi:hypothetical protein
MQQGVAAFVASTDRPHEETPYISKLYPRSSVLALPVCKGGMSLPCLSSFVFVSVSVSVLSGFSVLRLVLPVPPSCLWRLVGFPCKAVP